MMKVASSSKIPLIPSAASPCCCHPANFGTTTLQQACLRLSASDAADKTYHPSPRAAPPPPEERLSPAPAVVVKNNAPPPSSGSEKDVRFSLTSQQSSSNYLIPPQPHITALYINPQPPRHHLRSSDRHAHLFTMRKLLQKNALIKDGALMDRTRLLLLAALDFLPTKGEWLESRTAEWKHFAGSQSEVLSSKFRPLERLAEHRRRHEKTPLALPIREESSPLFINPNCLGFGVKRTLFTGVKTTVDRSRPMPSDQDEDEFSLPLAPSSVGKRPVSRSLDPYEAPLVRPGDISGLEGPKETNKLHHLILTWTTSPAFYVEVAGTFTDPQWTKRLPLFWCGVSQCHWIDVHEIAPRACGVQQFKFIVDGIWKCDPSYPICDDGSIYHHLNNVMRLNRRQSASMNHNNPFTIYQQSESNTRRSTVKPKPRSDVDTFHLGGVPVVDAIEVLLDDRGSHHTPGELSSDTADNPETNVEVGLLRIPSWACRVTLDSSSVAHTTPAALSKSNSRTVLESRWRLAGGIADFVSDPLMNNPMHRDQMHHVYPPQRGGLTKNGASLVNKPPIISGSGSATAYECRFFMIPHQHFGASPLFVHPKATIDLDIKGRRKDKVISIRANGRKQRATNGSKPLDGGSLVRCLSHHGGRTDAGGKRTNSASVIKLADWPPSVTELLHAPEVLLQLLLPSNVVKMANTKLELNPGWSMTPHPEKILNGGADSFYISSDHRCLALADGVGEWDDFGFSAQSFADELMLAIQAVWEDKGHPIHRLLGRLPPATIARELMNLACTKPRSYGSATCCVSLASILSIQKQSAQIAIFDEASQQLGVCNLGDSGVQILRRGKKYQMIERFRTRDLCHFFNCPFQLSRNPPAEVLAKMIGIENVENGKGFVLPSEDLPKHAKCYNVGVEEGDLVLMASDGLWDNLWDSEIRGLCNLALAPFEALILHDETLVTGADDVARAVIEAASFRSRDCNSRTPFAKSYTLECGKPAYVGGKCDDITVVAAWVSRKSLYFVGGKRSETSPACLRERGEEERDCEQRHNTMKSASLQVPPHRFPYRSMSDQACDSVDSDAEFTEHLNRCRGSTSGKHPTTRPSPKTSGSRSSCRRIKRRESHKLGARFGEA